MVVEDNVVTFPALLTSGIPWVRIASCNPAEIKDHLIPPPFSGLPTSDGPSGMSSGPPTADTRRTSTTTSASGARSAARRALPRYDFIHESPWLNLYLYPEAIDYPRARPLGHHWHNLAGLRPDTDAAWDVPRAMRDGDDPLDLPLAWARSARPTSS